MKNEDHILPASQELSPRFAPRREEAPLLSPPQVETLLARHDMLPNTSFITVRRIIMTLTGLSALGAIAFFALFNPTTSHRTDASYGMHRSHETHAPHATPSQTPATPTESTNQQQPPKPGPAKVTRGPWSAGNDQYYADLTREELAQLGILTSGSDTLSYYDMETTPSRPWEQVYQRMTLTSHLTSLEPVAENTIPANIHAPTFFPVLITTSGGNSCDYRYKAGNESGLGSLSSEEKDIMRWREWLDKPSVPGYRAFTYTTTLVTTSPCEGCTAVELDTIALRIGKNLPDRPYPKAPGHFASLTDTQQRAFVQLMHYYDGSAEKPRIKWPDNLAIKVDTITIKDFQNQLDSEENSSVTRRGRSIFGRISELVPVIVRRTPSNGKPDTNDFVFWYEPSDELFAALPPNQAKAFRERSMSHPACLAAPNAVMQTAEITYCSSEEQEIELRVQDLTGRTLIVAKERAHSGDNTFNLGTETLSSGMYLVTILEKNGVEQTRRIWVENAHPKTTNTPTNEPSDGPFVLSHYANPSSKDSSWIQRVGIPKIPLVEIPADVENKLGIESDERIVRYYAPTSKPDKLFAQGILRKWGVEIRTVDSSEVHVAIQSMRPRLVTDGLGRKRIEIIGDSGKRSLEQLHNIIRTSSEIATLVPVLFRATIGSDSIGPRDLIFWYRPTPEFLALLPDSSRNLAIAQTQSDSVINIGHGGYASVEAMHGAIHHASVFPNPSKGKLTVKLVMDAPRTLTFTLRNLLGQEVTEPIQQRVEGESEQKLDFSRLPEGIYLLDITSDAGERYVQRLVIER